MLASSMAYSHDHSSNAKDVEVALSLFEKSILLSPELLSSIQKNSVTPFYKVGKHKVYLDEGFWNLTKAWVRIYINDIEKHCNCDLDPDIVVEEARKHLPQGFLKQKILSSGKHFAEEASYTGVYITAKYGYVMAGLKLSAEVAETIISVFLGMKGIHVVCTAIDIMLYPIVRGIQKHTRSFFYGRQLESSGGLVLLKTAWFSRQIRKSKKKVFFHIDQALEFRDQELKEVNEKGPKSLFNKQGHRLTWLENLKHKTDPLFKEIRQLELNLDAATHPWKKQQIEKQILKKRNKIEKISKVSRKDFFGHRFKRFLFLKSRKGKKTYMVGKDQQDKMVQKGLMWPLSLQENVIEPSLSSKTQKGPLKLQPDLIRDGLIEEFLSQKFSDENLDNKKETIQSFLKDIESIFDTRLSSQERLMKVYILETAFGVLLSKFFKVSFKALSKKYHLSFSDRLRLHWNFGRFFHSIYDFSDFLTSVAVIKNKKKIQFHKYESMEKTLALLSYLYEMQKFLKNKNLNKVSLFEKLNSQKYYIESISLSKNKNRKIKLIPFVRKNIECKKLVEKAL
ncbi:MAG: hypothetical protein ACR2M7_04925 [Bdellovibrionales bacterium]